MNFCWPGNQKNRFFIVKEISVIENRITITLSFPFAGIPIEDQLINSVRDPVEKLGAEVEVKTTLMNQEEVQKFLSMEQEEKGLLTRCVTPYIASGNVMVEPSYKDDDIFVSQGIKLINVKAVGIDRKGKTVITADGSIFPYDKLVLATGAKPVVFPVSGADLPGVFTLRRSGDAVNILHWINSMRVKNAVVIGAGAIGIEIAYLFSLHGIRITLVEILEHIMQSVLDSDMSEGLERYIRENGVELKLKQKVEAIIGEREVESVALSSGENIKAEMVIISGGAWPNVDLAKKAELEIGELGLKVNEYLQTSDSDIYAAGDLIEYESFVTGKPILGQLRPNAVIGGRVIAKNILGYKVKFPGLINSFATKFLGKTIAGAGVTESEAERNGINVVAVRQDSASKHSMMRGKKPYTVKLIFNTDFHSVISVTCKLGSINCNSNNSNAL